MFIILQEQRYVFSCKMKHHVIFSIVILLIGFDKINGENIWKFGKDEHGSVLAAHHTGFIPIFHKVTKVPVIVSTYIQTLIHKYK